VCWLYVLRDTKWTKVPYQPDGRKADPTGPATWASFEYVQCAYYSLREVDQTPFDGVGYVLTADDPFTVFDFDHCRNPETGEIDTVIASYLSRLDSYTEISPSGTGLRVIVEAKLPVKHRRLNHIEMYDNKRFISITGHLL
jgi:putative DNA primase/helicase